MNREILLKKLQEEYSPLKVDIDEGKIINEKYTEGTVCSLCITIALNGGHWNIIQFYNVEYIEASKNFYYSFISKTEFELRQIIEKL